MEFVNYYKILELPPTANADEIKTAYRQLAKTTHPDKNHEDKQATSNFQKLNDAYSTLSDTKKRRLYDLEHERQRRTNQPRFGTRSNKQESTNGNAGPSPFFGREFHVDPQFIHESKQIFVRLRAAEDWIRHFKFCVSSTGKEVQRQKRTIEEKERAVRVFREEIWKDETRKAREYDYGQFWWFQPSNLERIREDPQIQAKTRRKVDMEAELKKEEDKLRSLEGQLLDFRRQLSSWGKEKDVLDSRYRRTACIFDPLNTGWWTKNSGQYGKKKKKQASPDVQPGTRDEFEGAERRRRQRKGERRQETPTSFQGESGPSKSGSQEESAGQSGNRASGN